MKRLSYQLKTEIICIGINCPRNAGISVMTFKWRKQYINQRSARIGQKCTVAVRALIGSYLVTFPEQFKWPVV